MKVGFTGTRKGMTKYQKDVLTMYLDTRLENDQRCTIDFHHGDCIGADKDAHDMIIDLKKIYPKQLRTFVHPPSKPEYRAYCKGDVMFDPMNYLARDEHIVNCSEFLIACPRTDKEEQRSGTWATIRYAKKIGKCVVIINPK